MRSWGRRNRKLAAERDPLVLGALDAGITREEIHIQMGIARTTVDNIARKRGQND